jgi:hypothetical protein
MIQRQDQIAFIGGGGSVRRKYVYFALRELAISRSSEDYCQNIAE